MFWQNKNTKKSFLVFLSLVFGALIIFGTAKIAGVFGTSISFTTSRANNGAWKSALSVIPGINTPTRVEKGNVQIDEALYAATTTTDLIARRLLVEYVASQKGAATTTMSDADAQNIANSLAQEVQLPQEKQYTLSDLNISSDNSHDANTLYINRVNALAVAQLVTEQKENEVTMMQTAMNTRDATLVSRLGTKADIYQLLIKDLLAVKTPSSVAPIHLHLIQSYEALRAGTTGLQSILVDPAKGIVALSEYRNGIDELLLVKQEYADFYANF